MEPVEAQKHRVDAIESYGTLKLIQSSEILFSMGETVSEIGFILEGQISARVFSENGQQTWIGQFSAGDYIGHTAYLIEKSSAYEAVADTHTRIVMLQPHAFETLLKDDIGLAHFIRLDLAHRLDKMTRRLLEAVTLSAPGRVCAELQRMANPIGNQPETWIIRPNPVFVEIALRISSTRETVSRTVAQLQNADIVSRRAGAIIIHDMDRLRRHIR